MFKIKTLNHISETCLRYLPERDYVVSAEEADPDGILVRSFDLHDMDFPLGLKAVARVGAGTNNIPLERCSERGIVVFNTPGANANAVKELVIAALLLSSRKIYQGIEWVQSLRGQPDVAGLVEKGKAQFVGPEICGKRIGVIGLGAIGVRVANDCYRLDMEVWGYDPYISVDAAWHLSRRVMKAASLEEMYQCCDYITVHIPYNKDAAGMFNKDSFALMKKGVRFLNFSRGELVNNADLREAIASGQVGSYVTDFPTEELLGVDNVLTIPHLGASTPESEENCATMAAMEMKNYLEYGNINNSVNMPACQLPYSGKKRICVIHRNVPKVVVSLTTILGDKGFNIADMLNKSKGDYAYTIVDIDEVDTTGIQEEMMKIGPVIRVRII